METAPSPKAVLWRRDRMFYTGFALGAIAVVFAAFGRTYYLKSYTGAPPLPSLVHLHAAVFSVWMGLFAVQTWLVMSKQVAVHRRLGVVGGFFAIALVVLGYVIAILGAQTGWTGPGNPRDASEAIRFLVVPLSDLVVFVGLFGLALWFRRRPETHKRLVLLAMTGGILPAAFGRLGLLGIPVGLSFLGPAWSEARLLSLGYSFEQAIPPRHRSTRRCSVSPAALILRASAGYSTWPARGTHEH